jgi:hypothetical protein
MAFVLADRVKESTTTTGTGTITLSGAAAGFQSFAAVGSGNTTYYCIASASEWEVGFGTYTSGVNTLTRTTVLDSSNGGALVNFGTGSKDVFVAQPAGRNVTFSTGQGWGGVVPNSIDIPFNTSSFAFNTDGALYLSNNTYYDGTNWRSKVNAAASLTPFNAGGGFTTYKMAAVAAGSVQSLVSLLSVDSSGNTTAAGNVTAYSDERYKTNWRVLPKDFVYRLSNVKSGVFDRTDEAMTQVGVSAQSLREVMPEAIHEDADGKLSVAYGNAAMAACVAMAQKIVELEERLKKLEGS